MLASDVTLWLRSVSADEIDLLGITLFPESTAIGLTISQVIPFSVIFFLSFLQ